MFIMWCNLVGQRVGTQFDPAILDNVKSCITITICLFVSTNISIWCGHIGQCQDRTCIIINSVFVCFLARYLLVFFFFGLLVFMFVWLFVWFFFFVWCGHTLYQHNTHLHHHRTENQVFTTIDCPWEYILALVAFFWFDLSTPSSSPVHHRRSANQFDPPLEDNVNAGPAFRKCSTNVDTPFHYVSILPLLFVSSFVCLFVLGLAMCCCWHWLTLRYKKKSLE